MAETVSQIDQAVDQERQRRGMTPLQRRFVRFLVLDPGNASKAAIRAGYSARSARTIASRLLDDPLIQSELAKHFIDEQSLVASNLNKSLLRIQKILDDDTADIRHVLKAVKAAQDHGRLAVNVLGLNLSLKEKFDAEAIGDLSADELIRVHLEEVERLKALKDGQEHPAGTPGTSVEVGEGELQQ